MLTLFPTNREIRIRAARFHNCDRTSDITKSSLLCRGRGIFPAWSQCVTEGKLCCTWVLLRLIDPAAFCATPILSEETKHPRMKGGWGAEGAMQIFRELLQGIKAIIDKCFFCQSCFYLAINLCNAFTEKGLTAPLQISGFFCKTLIILIFYLSCLSIRSQIYEVLAPISYCVN